jgi:glycosyltransferase involved in cell wall biosynthesis
MKLLFVSNLYPPYHLGGYEQLCHEVATRLSARGHDITILTSTFKVDRETIEPGIQRRLWLESDVYYYHPRQVLKYRSIQAHNRRVIEETLGQVKPEVIVVWGMWNMSRQVAADLEALAEGRVVYYLGNEWPNEPSAHEGYWDSPTPDAGGRLFKQALRGPMRALLQAEWRPYHLKYEYVLACSQAVIDGIRAGGVAIPGARVLYHGIDTEMYLAAAQAAHNQDDAALKIVFVGSLVQQKGVHTAVEAMGLLQDSDPALPVSLHILGKGHPEYEAQLHDAVRRWRIDNRVTFHAPITREQLPQFLAQFNSLVLPSVWAEPLARISQEGMAAQLAVVGTPTGGTKEILSDGVNGLVFPPDDAPALAEQWKRLVRDPALRRQLATKGAQLVSERFTMERMLHELENYLGEVVAIAEGRAL